MIIDTLTKFNYRRKIWLTPEHPFCSYDEEYKVMYSSAIIMQAQLNMDVKPLNNFELERLMKYGLKLQSADIAWALRNSKENEMVIQYIMTHIKTDKEKIIFILDVINVSMRDDDISAEERRFINALADKLGISEKILDIVEQFCENAYAENIPQCHQLSEIIRSLYPDIEMVDLKYYVMQLYESVECTQRLLNEKKVVRIVDRCQIYDDIILYPGMKLIFDHALVRIFGNISVEGGELIINNSKIIRKSGSHRACINLRKQYSRIQIRQCEADCRNYGMFIRAEAGEVAVADSEIYQTTRGAAVRFWGDSLTITGTHFSECYSPEDGGAIMARGGAVDIEDCTFSDCEAKRGGAIYAVNGTKIRRCSFDKCTVAEFGAAVFYLGIARDEDMELEYKHCHPTGAEFVQILSQREEFRISEHYRIRHSVILDCRLVVECKGELEMDGATIYLNYPVRCSGRLSIKNSRIVCNHIEASDMMYFDNAKSCNIYHSEFDGMLRSGGLNAIATRITVTKSLFRNMSGGRAIYNAYFPEIKECIFNFCQNGAIYSQGGNVERCVFVNCRAKTGAGVQMYGNKGTVSRCNFKRCISEFGGGGVDRAVGQTVSRCLFEECKPADYT